MVAVIAAFAASGLATRAPYCTTCGSASSRTRWREVTWTETLVGGSSVSDDDADVGADHPRSPSGRRRARVAATRRACMPL